MADPVAEAEQSLARVIVLAQSSDGGFDNLCSASRDFQLFTSHQTTFFPSLVLSAIVGSPQLRNTAKKTADFLRNQIGTHGSFNYWQRKSPEYLERPYPDDLDDTFCALSALTSYKPEAMTGDILARATTLLTATETKPGGPYRTWLVGPDADPAWQNVDLAVNSNIAYFLSLQNVVLPGLTEFLEGKIKTQDYRSSYYPLVYPIVYFLARGYRGECKDQIIEFIMARQENGIWDNPMHTALMVSSLVRLGCPSGTVRRAVSYLSQHASQSALPYPFCIDQIIDGQPKFAGASALTAAFGLEAFSLWRTMGRLQVVTHPEAERVYRLVLAQAKMRFSGAGPELSLAMQSALTTVLDQKLLRQVVLLPYYFRQALGDTGGQTTDEFLIALGSANVYGWLAYTVYDDILDGESELARLPVANACLRELSHIYETILPDTDFSHLFCEVMGSLENANAWEVANTRFTGEFLPVQLPDYGNYEKLAQRSFGHALGPLAILYRSGFSRTSSELENIRRLFHNYLIARQLNDDAHDWDEDLSNGQINSVAVMILKDWQQQNPEQSLSELPLPRLLPELRKLFWSQTINQVCKIILDHINLVRGMGTEGVPHMTSSFLAMLLQPLEQAVAEAKSGTKKAEQFLEVYEGEFNL